MQGGAGPGGAADRQRVTGLTGLEPVGNYAVQPTFSDGRQRHLSWDYLLATWARYQAELAAVPMPPGRGGPGPAMRR